MVIFQILGQLSQCYHYQRKYRDFYILVTYILVTCAMKRINKFEHAEYPFEQTGNILNVLQYRYIIE